MIDKKFRPCKATSGSVGFMTLTIHNREINSKTETIPNEIIGRTICSYEIDNEKLIVTTQRDSKNNLLDSNGVLTLTYNDKSPEFNKMWDYVLKSFEIEAYTSPYSSKEKEYEASLKKWRSEQKMEVK